MTRVLIIKTSSMGDIVHNLPVIADLRRNHPDFVVDWVVEEAYADLVRLTRGVTRVLPVSLRRWRRVLRRPSQRAATREERNAFLEGLRAESYDVVLDTQGLVKSALLARRARLARDGVRAGFAFGVVRERLARLFYDRGYAVDPRLHAIERMRALAAGAFGDDPSKLGPPRFELEVPAGPLPWLGAAAASYVVLLHATARPEKAWPPERWTGLIARLSAVGLTAVLPYGNAEERRAAEQLVAEAIRASPGSTVAATPPPFVAPAMSLVDAAVLMKHARAVVGVDTGLLHLAAALDAPTVGLFGATPRWRYAPYWSARSINLGSFGTLGAQPELKLVLDALRDLAVLPADVAD